MPSDGDQARTQNHLIIFSQLEAQVFIHATRLFIMSFNRLSHIEIIHGRIAALSLFTFMIIQLLKISIRN